MNDMEPIVQWLYFPENDICGIKGNIGLSFSLFCVVAHVSKLCMKNYCEDKELNQFLGLNRMDVNTQFQCVSIMRCHGDRFINLFILAIWDLLTWIVHLNSKYIL